MANLTNKQRAEIGLQPKPGTNEQYHQDMRDRRAFPPSVHSLEELLAALDARISLHPRGLTGVAMEMRSPRRSLQRWLDGTKMPSNDRMKKMAEVIARPIPMHAALRSEIKTSDERPAAGRRGPSSKWTSLLSRWQLGEGVDVAPSAVPSLRGAANNAGQSVSIVTISSRLARATRTK